MEEKSLFEKMGGTYRKAGDYYIPNIVLPEPKHPIGIWGERHHEYLGKTKKFVLLSFSSAAQYTITSQI